MLRHTRSIFNLFGLLQRRVWYSNRPLGHNTLPNTVARLCSSAGIQGHKTNHSLRATATSRLYQSGVEEQQVMERTGHRTVEGVRSYKRTSEQQQQALSDILNQPCSSATSSSTVIPAVTSATSNSLSLATASTQQLQRGIHFPSATFNNCTITFNATPSVDHTPPKKKRRALISTQRDIRILLPATRTEPRNWSIRRALPIPT